MKTKKKEVKKIKQKKAVVDDTIKRTKIRVIGVGGGAGSIISEIASRIKKADFVVANTDLRALKTVKKAKRFQFGQGLTNGLGTGMNPELGETAALQEKDKIKKLFEGQDLCIIIACLGGGTGSGATSVFAKISKSAGCLTYGIFTLPFEFEGEKKMEIAKNGLEKIRPHLNAFSVIPNERIFQIIDKNTPLKEALSAINERLVKNLEGLIEMIYLPGLINIDFADLKTILSGRGRLAYLNTLEIGEPDKEETTKKIISSPLYPYTIKGARGILYNMEGGKGLQLSKVSQISKLISDLVNKNAKIIFGINQSLKQEDKIRITLLAIGCVLKNDLIKIVKKIEKKKRKRAKPKPKPLPPLPLPPKPKPKPKPKRKPKPKIAEEKKEVVIPDGKIRRNALQLKKVIEEEEKEILEKEKVWETPAIFRRKAQ